MTVSAQNHAEGTHKNAVQHAAASFSANNKRFFSVEEAAHWLGVGRSLFYELMGTGKFRTVRLGGRRLVDAASLAEFATSLPDAGKEM
jgi:excisionase family DNA binding protein